MSKRLHRHADCLRVLSKANPKLRKAILSSVPNDLLKSICDCSHNVLSGNIRLTPGQKRGLSRHKNTLRQLSNKKIPLSRKRRTLIQKGGFLSLLLSPIISAITSLFGGRK
ncbi:Hypp6079 [Branchiostoma lanceolatum]|uniref:Hypp6079 protein n=1 Tax=Branchiostoma lanceolatum TaxID=7740 RepID=A0A8J9W0M8_BRALA|nr:Hypp6079 [Branchiostoma lanceolatum]